MDLAGLTRHTKVCQIHAKSVGHPLPFRLECMKWEQNVALEPPETDKS